MGDSQKMIVFYVAKQQFALYLRQVEQVIHAVEITPLPKSPKHIAGTINYHGEFLPVVNMRRLFQLKNRDIGLNDQLIIVETPKIRLALWVDFVDVALELKKDNIDKGGKVYLDLETVEGLFRLDNGLVLITDIDKFLTEEQISNLAKAIQKVKESKVLKA